MSYIFICIGCLAQHLIKKNEAGYQTLPVKTLPFYKEDFAEYSYFDIEERRGVLMLLLILLSPNLQDILCH